jgi:copper resistance protein C
MNPGGCVSLFRSESLRKMAVGFVTVMLLFLVRYADAHAILVASTPGENGVVAGPDLVITLRFNVRVDGVRSRISLVRPDMSVRQLSVNKQTSPDTLTAGVTGLKPDAYRIRWQVLAADGHISNGEVPFTVRGRQ